MIWLFGHIPPHGESSASIGNTILGIFSLISRLQRVSIEARGSAGSLSGWGMPAEATFGAFLLGSTGLFSTRPARIFSFEAPRSISRDCQTN